MSLGVSIALCRPTKPKAKWPRRKGAAAYRLWLGYLWRAVAIMTWQTGTEKFTRCVSAKWLNFLIGGKGREKEKGGWWCINKGQHPSEKCQTCSDIAVGWCRECGLAFLFQSKLWVILLWQILFEEEVNAPCFHWVNCQDLHCSGRWNIRSGKRWCPFNFCLFLLFFVATNSSSSLHCP